MKDPKGTWYDVVWPTIKDVAHHTWVGLKLFGANVSTSTGIVYRHMRGK
jgi:hypothetical protein